MDDRGRRDSVRGPIRSDPIPGLYSTRVVQGDE